jgi:cell division protein ZapA (FtsZ GTPase activity inhibitor)
VESLAASLDGKMTTLKTMLAELREAKESSDSLFAIACSMLTLPLCDEVEKLQQKCDRYESELEFYAAGEYMYWGPFGLTESLTVNGKPGFAKIGQRARQALANQKEEGN